MADWYVSSVTYAAIPVWQASTAYSVGQIVRPVTPSTVAALYPFRCTTAGTSGSSEPSWATAPGNSQTITSGGATFTNVAGQSTYGWSAAAGSLFGMCAQGPSGRAVTGDRVFVASDHSETNHGSDYLWNNFSLSYGVLQIISVNRAGSVPPVAADIQNGATIVYTSGMFILDAYCQTLYQGFTFNFGGATSNHFYLNNNGMKSLYFKNCAFVFTNTTSNLRLVLGGNPCKITFDNTTVQFGHASQGFIVATYAADFTWINTPSALPGAAVPTTLFPNTSSDCVIVTCRGVDFSALTGTFWNAYQIAIGKILLDSCRIASGLTRFNLTGNNPAAADEMELVNCYDGTNIINERYNPAGAVTIDRSTVLSGGAQDDVGAFSFKLASNTRSDKFVLPLESFWIDIENTLVGSAKTANVEIASLASTLNNDDIQLLLEYMGTAGSPVASFANSLATPLTASAALTTSTATWAGPSYTTWNPSDTQPFASLSNGNLTVATSGGGGGGRATNGFSSGKYYFEVTMTTWNASDVVGIYTSAASVTTTGVTGQAVVVKSNGQVYINGSNMGNIFGTFANGVIIGIAVDVTNRKIWFRSAPSGNWNANASYDPATGVGGYDISAMTGFLFPGITFNLTGTSATANFGASAFSGAVPSGFTSGWPGTPGSKQKLQVSFTPNAVGRLRGLVRLGKTSTTVWVNPQITLS